jgi:hypothetical protein
MAIKRIGAARSLLRKLPRKRRDFYHDLSSCLPPIPIDSGIANMTHKLAFWVVPFVAAMTASLAGTAFDSQTRAEFKGATVESWAATLKADDVESRRHAAAMLAEMGGGARRAMSDLVEALDDSDPEVRRLAVQSLGNIGLDALEASGLIADKLADGDMSFQRDGVRALRNIVRQSPAAQKVEE